MRGLRQFVPYAAILILAFICLPATVAQENRDLRAEGKLVVEAGPFGLSQTLIRGTVSNHGEGVYGDIQVTALAHDATGAILAEGEGYLTRACGNALNDYVLAPGAQVNFVVPLETQNGTEIASHQIIVTGKPQKGEEKSSSAFQLITAGEVVVLEWLSATLLQFATGCATAPFTELSWQEYRLNSELLFTTEHHLNARIDGDFRAASGIDRYTQSGKRDELLYAESFLRSHHQARRFVFQNDLGHLMTAERNGSYPRLVDESSFRNSLQGIDWLGDGRFLAYTYGTFGDEVRYLTAHVDGLRISGPISESLPSHTRPGSSSDGLLFVLGLADAEPPGYYLKLASRASLELLHATPLPGNNAPAPILYRDASRRLAYLITPADGEASWQLLCVNRDTGDSRMLTNLPLQLPVDQRAWLALSPDGKTLALAADGGQGGLWIFDLPMVPC